VGANAGLSTRGISVAWDNTHLRPGSPLLAGVPRRCTPFELVLRRLLQYSDSIETGVQIVSSHLPRPMADIIIIGDGPARRALAMEMAGSTFALRPMEADSVWSANSFVSPTLGPQDKRGVPTSDPEETGSRLGRYVSYSELIAHSAEKVTLARAVEILRDPYPREKSGYIYPPARPRTICRPVTSFSLVMQPEAARLWVGDPQIPAPLGRYLGFDLLTELPLQEAPIPPTGFQAAVQSCRYFSAGRYPEALSAVEKALALDGPSVPLHLMLAQIHQALHHPEAACLHRDQARLLSRKDRLPSGEQRIPFPSAINPILSLAPDTSIENEDR
jgi:hypothetical protein